MITFGLSLPSLITFSIAFSSLIVSILNVSLSTSTNIGVAPLNETTSPVEKNVKSGTNTASPSFIFHAIRRRVIASVPFAHVIQCLTPTYSANLCSKMSTSFPPMKFVLFRTSWIAESISFLYLLY